MPPSLFDYLYKGFIMAYIYLIDNDINDKVYIGKTLITISERYSRHIYDAKNYLDNSAIHHAMQKYGYEHFQVHEIEKCPNDILSEREKYWIAYYDSYNNGYNLTSGGDGNPLYDYNLIYSMFQKGMTQKEIALQLGCEKHTITRALKTFDISKYDRQKGKYGNSRKSVIQININTNEILKQFSSMTAAAEYEGCSVAMMSLVCNGKRKLLNRDYTYKKEK